MSDIPKQDRNEETLVIVSMRMANEAAGYHPDLRNSSNVRWIQILSLKSQ